jgi:hypothetical protein
MDAKLDKKGSEGRMVDKEQVITWINETFQESGRTVA